MESVLEVLGKIEQEAAVSSPECRVIKSIKIGDAVRQGDIYIRRVDPKHAKGGLLKTLQLAPGSNSGSRHCVEGAECYAGADEKINNAVRGPVIVAKDRFKVTHPEHAHFDLPKGTYQVTYQLDARTLQRVRD